MLRRSVLSNFVTEPLVVELGDLVQIRIGNLGPMDRDRCCDEGALLRFR